MKSTPMLLLATMMAAALSCAPGDETPMTSNKQSYSVPFDPRVPPVFPASIINDEFRAQSPIIDSVGPRKFVSLDPKWSNFVPGVGSTFAAQIDPIRQMAQMSGIQEKRWGGIMQDLPIPAVGEQIGYYIVARVLNGWVDSSANADYGPQAFGMLFGDTMRDNPEASQLWFNGTMLQRVGSEVTAEGLTSDLLTYEGTLVPDGACPLPAPYLSAQIISVQISPGVFESQIVFGQSQDGIFFQELYTYADLEHSIPQFAIAQQTQAQGMGTFLDFVRYYPIAVGDDLSSDPPNGQILQLGSV
jgi:hypothetical protein